MNRIVNLSQFGFLAVNGPDAKKFLQGYTTCDVHKISENNNLGAICNLKGRMVTNFRIALLEEGLLLRMHKNRVKETINFLSTYIIFSKVELKDVSYLWHCFGIIEESAHIINKGDIRLHVSDTRCEIWTKNKVRDSTSMIDWATQDCAEGLAWIETDTAERFLPQMFYLDKLGGLDFKKGCYLGQEIIARAEYLGNLKRRLHLFYSESSLNVGDEITIGNSKGNIVATGANIGLVIIANIHEEKLLARAPNGDPIELTPLNISA